jgi:hypothetical protein
MGATGTVLSTVMAGLDPAIHDDVRQRQPYGKPAGSGLSSWMRGSSPRMTAEFAVPAAR